MAWEHDVTLISRKQVDEDELLQPIFEEQKEEIACNKRSLTRSEFYAAAQADMKPTMILEVHSFEYDKQDYLDFEGERYKVIKTFEKSPEIIELTCEKAVETSEVDDG